MQNCGRKSLLNTVYSDKELITITWVLCNSIFELANYNNQFSYYREVNTIPQVVHHNDTNLIFVLVSCDDDKTISEKAGICKSEYVPLRSVEYIKNVSTAEAVFRLGVKDFSSHLDIEKDLESVMEYRDKLLKELALADNAIQKHNRKTAASKLYNETRAEIEKLQEKLNTHEKEMGINIDVLVPFFK